MSYDTTTRNLIAAARAHLSALDALRDFERDNPNDTTKQWAAHLQAVDDAEKRLRTTLAKAEKDVP